MTFYEFTVNTIVEHPVVFGFCVLCLLAILDKVKEVIVGIFTKGRSETNKKPPKTDDVVEPDYIIINKKDN